MGWKKNVPVAGALGAVVVGGIAMTLPASAASVPTAQVTTQSVQQVVDGEGEDALRHHGRHHGGGMRGEAVAAQLGIEVEVYRDAVKAVIEVRQDAGEERPNPADLTPAERLAARADWIADISAGLGISADDLETAHDTVFAEKLAQAVTDEEITQAEADEMAAAYADGTLFDLRQEQRLEAFGDKLDDLLETGIIDDTQYDALQAALDAEDTETLRGLLREFREDNGFGGRGLRGGRGPAGINGFGGPGGAPDADASSDGISL